MDDKQENGILLDLAKLIMTLIDEKFVRVDGLKYWPIGGDERIIPQSVSVMTSPVIRHDTNNGTIAVVTPTGAVWIRTFDRDAEEVLRKIRVSAGNIPVEMGCCVPLSNGESISHRDILRRVANPEWIPDYHTTEEAREAGF